MSIMSSFFGLSDAEGNDKILRLAKILSILLPIVSVTISLTTTFFMIFVAEALGGGEGMFIEGMALVGVLVVIQMLIQTLLDYPTGALGDYIGQKYVIASAFLSFAAAYYLVSFVNIATPFAFFILIYVLMGFGNSQMSGAFMAWFDNNYRVAMPGDNDRKQYGVFWGKIGMLFQIVATGAMIPGSIIAVILGRAWVFQLQAVLCVVIAIAVFRLVNDFSEVKEARTKRPSMSEYTDLLKEGVSFLFSDKFVKNVIIGGCLVMSAVMVWGQLILFPMYFSYLLTDVAVSSFRTILFVPGIVSQERSGVWSRRFEPKKWIPRFRLLQAGSVIFYLAFAALMFYLPPAGPGAALIEVMLPFTQIVIMQLPTISILPVLLMTITFTFTGFFGGFAEILTQRELLDVIPNKIRNSMYSLSPTLGTLLAIPQIWIFGWLIPVVGFPITLVSCAMVSLVGVLMIRRGLNQPKPVPSDVQQDKSPISQAVPAE
ncbi:MAG: MFS transporter [Candidatus Thorarchaeota archaeon]|jgi:MFS family permease